MRIISGLLKGRSINFLKNLNTRPLKDSVKENIFNILYHSNLSKIKISGSSILDLYSGVGSFGIESISRGAKEVSFIEQDTKAFNTLKENLNKLSILSRTKIYNCKIENFLEKNLQKKYDIFFFDPPFSSSDYLKNLDKIKKKRLYKKNHIIIIHRENKSEEVLNYLLKIIKVKSYGRSKIIFGIFK